MTEKTYNIEDSLELLVGLQDHPLGSFNVYPSDSALLNSIGRQVHNGTALTDRQYALVKEKLLDYSDQFEKNQINGFSESLSNLRLPLRHVDRTKSITVVESIDNRLGSVKGPWIKIRFLFNKKTITSINAIAYTAQKDYYHSRGSHEHYFQFNEHCTYLVVKEFKDRNFKIDDEILEYYDAVVKVRENRNAYLPLFINGEILNVSDELRATIVQETDNDPVKILDRRRRYGLLTDETYDGSGLLADVVNRDECEMLVAKNNVSPSQMLGIVHQLDRFPLLIGTNMQYAEQVLFKCYNILQNLVPVEEQSVLFRLEGDHDVNQFIKAKKLNNWVDRNTKVVYINSDKLPRILLDKGCEWSPITSIFFNSSINRFVDGYANERCDLTMFYDNIMSPIRKHSRLYQW
jgi:hypothetical protein